MNEPERSRLDVIEAKVDTLLVKFEFVERQLTDHEHRMRSVERWKLSIPISVLIAVATVVGAIVSGKGGF